MKLIWFSHFVPFPPRGGAPQRSFNLLRRASRSHEIILVALNHAGETGQQIANSLKELKRYCAEAEVWDLPYRWKGRRWWAQLAASPFHRAPFGCQAVWSPGLNARWQDILRLHPDAFLHFDASDLALFVPAAKNRKKVLNHHNCESAMTCRRAQKETNPLKKTYLWHQARKVAHVEHEICHQFDVNLAVSESDARLLLSRSPSAHIHIVPNGTDTDYFMPSESAEDDNTLIFAGSLRWYPNISALNFFIHEVWPLVKKEQPGARFCVAGQFPSRGLVRTLTKPRDVEVVASPEDIRPYVARAAAFVCPILDGGGTRIKILDAWAMGKAIVSTTVGCEGLLVKHGENILIADSPQEFALGVVSILRNRALRKQLALAGRSLVEKHYSWEVVGAALERAYRCALDRSSCVEHF
jgi:glycosyltransferase involved in cell wall biosynthesis